MSTGLGGGDDSVCLVSRFESQNDPANKFKGIDGRWLVFVIKERTHNSFLQGLCWASSAKRRLSMCEVLFQTLLWELFLCPQERGRL